MQAAGYEADTLALAPADDETLDLYALTQLNSTGVDP